MKFNRFAFALLLTLPLAAQAEITFTPFASYQWFDTNTTEVATNSLNVPDISAEVGYAVALGYRFRPAIAVEAHYGRTESATETMPGTSTEDVRNSRVSLDGYYAFNAEGSFSPYLLLGVGQTNLKYETANASLRDTIINAGFGAFYRFNDFVALRAEARNVHSVDYELGDLDDQVALLGLEFSPRNGSDAPVEAAPEPVVEEAPVEVLAAAEADSDNDGVADTKDLCANTPAGTKVDASGCPPDGDKDGVADNKDRCANTPAGTQVDASGCPPDGDKDGVADTNDLCANTPAGVKVDTSGCPLDGDKDGVPDYLDKCPATPVGVVVTSSGCSTIVTETVTEQVNVTFDSGKSIVKPQYKADIAKVSALLKQYPGTSVEIQGHTDSSGKAASNNKLSLDRANAVKDVMIREGGIEAERLTTKGFGSSQPIGDNATAEGKAQNRRVVAVISVTVDTVKTVK